MAFGAAAPASAAADTLALAASPNPLALASPATFTISGTSSSPTIQVDTTITPVGTGGCGATLFGDTPEGSSAAFLFNVTPQRGADGASYSAQSSVTTQYYAPGDYLICGWLEDASLNVLATASTVLTMRAPHDAVTLPRPFQAPVGKPSVTVAYQFEQGTAISGSRELQVRVGPVNPHGDVDGGGCNSAQAYTALDKRSLDPTGGTVTVPVDVSWAAPFQVCASLFSDFPQPEVASATTTITGVRAGVGGSGGKSPGAVTSLKLAARSVRTGKAVTFELTLRAAAKLTVQILRYVPTSGHGKQRHKAHYNLIDTVSYRAKLGANLLHVSRIGGHKLAIGRYRATVSASGRSHTVTFTVLA